MSSKWQVVIPWSLREYLGMEEGLLFAIYGEHDTVVLKKIPIPSKDMLVSDLKNLAAKNRRKLEQQGFT